MRTAEQIKAAIAELRPAGWLLAEGVDGLMCRVMCKDRVLQVIVSWGFGWDHVSVSRANKVPCWDDMIHVKRICFEPEEPAYMLAPPESRYVNVHPHVLHWWRPQTAEIPMPPREMV